MGMFFLLTFAFAIILYAVEALLIGLFGNGGWILVGILVVGALFAGLYVSYEKTRERQQRIEEKLDALLKEKDETT